MFLTEQDRERPDFELMADGAVTLFWRPGFFESTKAELAELGYRVIEVTCRTVPQVIADLSAAFDWGGMFDYEPWSGNLNALDDFFHSYGDDRPRDLAISFMGYHHVAAESPQFAQGLLDVIQYGSRYQALLGRRILALVQTDDASYEAPRLGAVDARWTRPEWFNASRGL